MKRYTYEEVSNMNGKELGNLTCKVIWEKVHTELQDLRDLSVLHNRRLIELVRKERTDNYLRKIENNE